MRLKIGKEKEGISFFLFFRKQKLFNLDDLDLFFLFQNKQKNFPKGIYHCGATIVKEEGITALWKGLTPFATHLTLKYALRMGTNALYSSALRDRDGNLSNGRRMLSGMLAGVTEALCIVTPFEVVKIRLQQQKGTVNLQYRGPVHAAATILRQEGLRGLWSGAAPTVARNGTNQMCLFAAKNQFDRLYWGKQKK